MKRKIIYFIKIAVTLFLIGFLFSKINLFSSLREIKNVKIHYYFLSLFFMILTWVANTLRWKALLKIFNNQTKFFRLFLYNLASIFYTTILPGGKIAGETVRAYQVSRDHKGESLEKKQMFLLVFLDRAMGLLGLIIFISIYFFVNEAATGILGQGVSIIKNLIWLAAILGTGFIFSTYFDFILKILNKAPFPFLRKFLNFVSELMIVCRSNKSRLVESLIYSFISVFLSALSVYMIILGLGLDINYLTIAFINSLAVVLIVVPITIGGVGLRESGLIYLLVQAGVIAEKSLALSLLNLLNMSILAIVGGIVELHFSFLKPKTNDTIRKNIQ